jgi:hypothetical protein
MERYHQSAIAGRTFQAGCLNGLRHGFSTVLKTIVIRLGILSHSTWSGSQFGSMATLFQATKRHSPAMKLL